MPKAVVNGVQLYYELSEPTGPALVLVHGSWVSHGQWGLVSPILQKSFQVLVYDRRGHSQSERPEGNESVRQDVDDLAGLIEHLELAPAWILGNSFGGSIVLRLAGLRPELFKGLIAHEPPLFQLLANDNKFASDLEEVGRRIESVLQLIASGDHGKAAKQFVESIALGPGAWPELPQEIKQTFIENAPTFLGESSDPEQLSIDLDLLEKFRQPVLLTAGKMSPHLFPPVVTELANALRSAEVMTFPESGHVPHVTQPLEYVETITSFIARNPGS